MEDFVPKIAIKANLRPLRVYPLGTWFTGIVTKSVFIFVALSTVPCLAMDLGKCGGFMMALAGRKEPTYAGLKARVKSVQEQIEALSKSSDYVVNIEGSIQSDPGNTNYGVF